MPVANVIRLSIFGDMPGGEVWSVNPVWQIGGVSTAEDISPAQALAMAQACAAVGTPAGLLGLWTSAVRLTGIRCEARRWNGDLATQAEALLAVPAAGTGTTAHSYQTSLVSSLRTTGIGASARGRLYWPAVGINVQATTLRPTLANITNALTGIKTYLTSLTTALDVTLTNSPVLSVWSRIHESTIPVSSIQVGDVLDVQRRRRDATIENYSSTSFP